MKWSYVGVIDSSDDATWQFCHVRTSHVSGGCREKKGIVGEVFVVFASMHNSELQGLGMQIAISLLSWFAKVTMHYW